MVLRVSLEDPAQPEIIDLLEDGERYSAGLYPAESNHHLPLEALRAANIRLLVARDDNGRSVATGALKVRTPQDDAFNVADEASRKSAAPERPPAARC
jgi:hypothetical protein